MRGASLDNRAREQCGMVKMWLAKAEAHEEHAEGLMRVRETMAAAGIELIEAHWVRQWLKDLALEAMEGTGA